jgi:uncharacterized protein
MRTNLPLRTAASAFLLVLLTGFGPQNDPPLVQAAKQGKADEVRELVRQGADVNAAQGDGMTALHWTAARNDVGSAEMLLRAGASITAETRIGGFTPLLIASQSGSTDVLRLLLEAGDDPNARTTTGGTTALQLAARSGDAQAVELLIDHGAEVDAREHSQGHTALMFAAAHNRPEAARALIARGADPSLVNDARDIAEVAEEENRLRNLRNEQVAALRELAARERYASNAETVGDAAEDEAARGEAETAGEDEAAANAEEAEEGNEPEAAAEGAEAEEDAESGEEEAAAEEEEEEEEGRPLNYAETVGGYGGFSALHLAARQGAVRVVDELLDAGLDINQMSAGDGSTALLIATINGHWDLARSLLERGADPTLAAANGVTPLYGVINLQWAPQAFYPQPRSQLNQETTYLDLMRAFLDAGADPNVRLEIHPWYKAYNFNLLGVDSQGATPFWRAAYGLDVRAMRLLLEYGADPTIATRTPPQRRRPAYQAGDEPEDPSGLPPARVGDPSVTPLHAASGAGHGLGRAGNQHRFVPGGWMPTVRFLVEEIGLDVNARDHLGYTPLHNAASRGDTEMIRYLVEHGADVTALSRRGQTTADMANGPVQRINPYPAAIRLLEELGSKNNNNCVGC